MKLSSLFFSFLKKHFLWAVGFIAPVGFVDISISVVNRFFAFLVRILEFETFFVVWILTFETFWGIYCAIQPSCLPLCLLKTAKNATNKQTITTNQCDKSMRVILGWKKIQNLVINRGQKKSPGYDERCKLLWSRKEGALFGTHSVFFFVGKDLWQNATWVISQIMRIIAILGNWVRATFWVSGTSTEWLNLFTTFGNEKFIPYFRELEREWQIWEQELPLLGCDLKQMWFLLLENDLCLVSFPSWHSFHLLRLEVILSFSLKKRFLFATP